MCDKVYLDLIDRIEKEGDMVRNRTGIDTLSVFSEMIQFDISERLACLTIKKMFFKSVVLELLWFIRGDTNTNTLGSKIWDGNTTRAFLDSRNLNYSPGIAGPIYGYQWRYFGNKYPEKNSVKKNATESNQSFEKNSATEPTTIFEKNAVGYYKSLGRLIKEFSNTNFPRYFMIELAEYIVKEYNTYVTKRIAKYFAIEGIKYLVEACSKYYVKEYNMYDIPSLEFSIALNCARYVTKNMHPTIGKVHLTTNPIPSNNFVSQPIVGDLTINPIPSNNFVSQPIATDFVSQPIATDFVSQPIASDFVSTNSVSQPIVGDSVSTDFISQPIVSDFVSTGDQLYSVLDMLINDRDSRRIILSAWNPNDIDKMALPPCHILVQFRVVKDKLCAHLYQRSADVFLGLPFNMLSYSILTHLFASVINLRPGKLSISIGDAHIYNTHFDAVNTMKLNTPMIQPVLRYSKRLQKIIGNTNVNDIINILENCDDTDFIFDEYKSHKYISAPMTV